MTRLQEIESQIETLSRAEKAQLMQRIAQDLSGTHPGIESTPGVCGGEPRIVRTRIPVWLLEQARKQGASDAKILESYPTLRAEDLTNSWAYVQTHNNEIQAQIAENEPYPS